MRAVVFHKPKDVRVEVVPDPKILEASDAIVRVTSTAICGSDLHLYNGLIPQLRPMVLGHEIMGVVCEVGKDVRDLKVGDRVVVPFPIACGHCWSCEHEWPTQCEASNKRHYGPRGGILRDKGGGLFGYTDLYGGYDGGQAEYVRVPFADYGPRKVPDGLSDDQVLFLSDILPTAWAGLAWADVQPGDTVAVYGCGPVGLMAQKAAWLFGARRVIGVDLVPERLEMARRVARSFPVDLIESDPIEAIFDFSEGRGADVVIDAVGMEADRGLLSKLSNVLHLQRGTISALKMAFSSVRRGGRVSVLGVYASHYDNFPLGQWLDKGLRVQAGQAPVHNYIDKLLDLVCTGELKLDDIITHRLPLVDAPRAYDIFNRKDDGCVKVVLRP